MKGDYLLAWNGSAWTISNYKVWPGILTSKGWGGFHSNQNGDVSIDKSIWKSYDVAVIRSASRLKHSLLCPPNGPRLHHSTREIREWKLHPSELKQLLFSFSVSSCYNPNNRTGCKCGVFNCHPIRFCYFWWRYEADNQCWLIHIWEFCLFKILNSSWSLRIQNFVESDCSFRVVVAVGGYFWKTRWNEDIIKESYDTI